MRWARTPCRALDTRTTGTGKPVTGTITQAMNNGACSVLPNNAKAFALNATVVPPGGFGYLSLWPDGVSQPLVSTLNAFDGSITSNMALVPSNNGLLDAYLSHPTQLILDVSGYFAP